jgi:signal transduction histidine kinase
MQNEKLIEFAFLNAHKVRGPLARVLGLSMLIKKDLSLEEIRDLNEKIQQSATELDNVIRDLGKRLETEENQ